ncbi:hypothetical protein HN011_007397 [Eciton burchellii]|nr:hypothetical protein HN011_007397 [Eciton burchellii]
MCIVLASVIVTCFWVQGRDQGKGGLVYLWKHVRRWSHRERVLIRRSGLKIEASTRSRRPVRDDAGWESAALSAAFSGKTTSLAGLSELPAHVETKRTDTEDRHTPIIDVINVTRCEFWERYDKHFSAFETERKRLHRIGVSG